MKRIVSVYLPQWAIERSNGGERLNGEARRTGGSHPLHGKPVDTPFALVETGHRGVRLSAVNGFADASGLCAGDALADARTRVPHLVVADAQASADREGLRRLARWLGRYGILRNAYGLAGESASGHRIRHYGLWVDISGVAHLFGGEGALLADLEARLSRFGLTARAGLADTIGAAHALAWHGGGSRMASQGEILPAIAALPVAALRLDAARVHLLHRLGFKTIGALARVPRVPLERRFRSHDPSQRVLLRLDQALGIKGEPRRFLVEPPILSVRRPFAEALISAQPLEDETKTLIIGFCSQLDAAGLGVRSVRLSLFRCDGSVGEICVSFSRPARAPEHMTGLLFEKLGNLDLGFGVDLLSLEALSTEKLKSQQGTLTQGAEQDGSDLSAQLVDRLVNRLGSERVTRLAARQSHWPECSEIREPALVGSQLLAQKRADFLKPAGVRRPVLLLGSPEPIMVMAEIPEGAPVQFTWRRVRYTVVRSQGPERIEAEWWKQLWPHAGSRARDYYSLEDKVGARFWVYREGRYDDEAGESSPGWFIHGVFA